MSTALEPGTAPPANFEHCQNVYKAMLSNSTRIEGVIVYSGFLTKLITQELSLSVPFYTSLMRELKRMGCVKQLKRGGGTAPSEWELVKAPTLDDFMEARPAKAPANDRLGALSQRVGTLERQLQEMKTWQDSINENLVALFGTEVPIDDEEASDG